MAKFVSLSCTLLLAAESAGALVNTFISPQTRLHRTTFVKDGNVGGCTKCLHMSATEDVKVEVSEDNQSFNSAMPTIYDKLGFAEDKIAVGIEPRELLQWLGTRDDLIGKFLRDNKGFDQARAETEVDKFVLDAEMVNKYIAYEKKKADPDFQRKSREENLSDPSVLGLYAAWITGGAGIAYFKNVIAAPKFASGEWQDIHIPLPDFFPFQQAADSLPAGLDAVSSSADAAVAAFDSAHNAIDAIAGSVPLEGVQSSVEGAAGAVSDVLQSGI